jgi:hypothetical protein
MTVPGADPARDKIVGGYDNACVHAQADPPSAAGLMSNWRGAVDCAAGDSTDWSLIMSDDAEPLPGWDRHMPRALGFSPRPMLGVIHFGGFGRTAAEHGYAYCVGTGMVWGGGIAYRTGILGDLAEYTRRFLDIDPTFPHDDVIAGLFADRYHGKPAMTARALFDHIPARSLVGHPSHETELRRPGLTIRETGPPWSTPGFARATAWCGAERAAKVLAQLR